MVHHWKEHFDFSRLEPIFDGNEAKSEETDRQDQDRKATLSNIVDQVQLIYWLRKGIGKQ
jgi:hypothetical protein